MNSAIASPKFRNSSALVSRKRKAGAIVVFRVVSLGIAGAPILAPPLPNSQKSERISFQLRFSCWSESNRTHREKMKEAISLKNRNSGNKIPSWIAGLQFYSGDIGRNFWLNSRRSFDRLKLGIELLPRYIFHFPLNSDPVAYLRANFEKTEFAKLLLYFNPSDVRKNVKEPRYF